MPKIYTQNIRGKTRYPPRAAAALVVGIFTLSLLSPAPMSASAWNPTLLVNTEAFQTVHEGDSTADVELRFGDTLSEKIYWDRTNAEFRFTDDIRADGNITASGTLTVSGNAKTKGDLTINSDNGAANAVLTFGNDDTAQTLTFIDAAQKFSFSKDMRVLGNLSGSTLNVDGNAGIYGQLTVSGATTLKSTLKIGGVTYTFPTSDGSASGKVLKTNSAGQLSWSGDNNSGGLSYADAKSYFVDDSGDSMTGALLIQTKTNGAAATADAGVQLEIVGVMSGSVLYASSGINSSGAVIIKTPVTTSATLGGTGALVVMQRIELGTGAYMFASGAAVLALDSPIQSAQLNGQASRTPHIVFGYRGAFDTNLYRLTGSTLATDDALKVGGNITGSGTLTIDGATTLQSTLKINGVTYTFPTSDGSASGKVLATNSAGTLAWTTPAGPAVTGSLSQTSHGFSVGDVLRYTGTKYATAKANAADNAEVVGIVSKVADANTFTLLTSGKITGLSGLTAGSVYFLSASSSGALTATQPSAPNVSKPLLIADSTTSGYFSNMRGIIGAGTTLTGSVLRVMSGANSYILGNTGIGTAAPETKLEVVGVISGASLHVTGNITMSGTVFNTLPLSTVEGRLTLTSGTPVTTSDVTGATTIYFTPYKGDRIYLYDGTRWKLYSFSELSLALGTVTSGLPYDVFLYDNGGTLTLEKLAWTNGTTRATALTTQNGVLVKSGAATRRYLGTFYTTSTTTTEDSAAKRLVWNYYNRVLKQMIVTESTDSWSYNSASWRQMNANTANQLAVVIGWSEDSISVNTNTLTQLATSGFGLTGIGEDSTTAVAAGSVTQQVHVTASNQGGEAHLIKIPAVGYHYYAALEYVGNGPITWYGDAGVPGLYIHGIFGSTRC